LLTNTAAKIFFASPQMRKKLTEQKEFSCVTLATLIKFLQNKFVTQKIFYFFHNTFFAISEFYKLFGKKLFM